MAAIILPHKWTSQPQYPVGIDWSNPITRGLEFAHNTALRGFEAKSNILCPQAGAVVWGPDGFSSNGTAGVYIKSKNAARLGSLAKSTVFTLSRTAASIGSGTSDIGGGGNAIYCERGSSGNDIYKVILAYPATGELTNTLSVEFTYRNDAGTLLQKRIDATGLNNNSLISSAIVKNDTTHYVYVNGRIANGTFGSSSTAFTDASVESWIGDDKGDAASAWNGSIPLVIGWSRALSKAELDSLRDNPWQIFQPIQRKIYVASAGATTHAATGALTADSATVAGTAAHIAKHDATGALTAQTATVAGTAERTTIHAATGALTAQTASIAGTAARTTVHAATGALTADVATIAGTAARTTVGTHDAVAALLAGSSIIAGTAAHIAKHAATGALAADSATIAGTAAHIAKHAATGALSAGAAVIVGAAARSGVALNHVAIAALIADSASVSGLGSLPAMWTTVSPASGTWTDKTSATGTWTDKTSATGTWTDV